MTASVLAAGGSAPLGFPLLTSIVVLPALGALVVALASRRRPELARMLALTTSVLTGALAIAALVAFDTGEAGFQMVEKATWISDLGISWHLGLDGISLFLVVMTGILFPIAIIGAPAHHDEKPFLAWMLLLEAGCLGVFVALDLFVFFVMFEIVLVPMYFLISGWGYAERRYAAVKFFLYTMFGSAFMLVGLIATAVLHARATGGDLTFDLVQIAQDQSIATSSARWLFLAFAVAFAVKVPVFPLHTWLPDAHTQAPTAGSVILAGVLLKLGTYGFLRFGLFLFPEASRYFAPMMLTLGTIGILYGAVVATMQKDLKRLVAYSSVAHLGFIVLGTFSITTQGLEGSVLQMVNHGISTGALFLLVGMISDRRHTREIAELKGLQRVAPVFAGVLLKLGTYGFLRFGLFLFPEASRYFAPMMLTLGTIGILYGAAVATMQKDLKRLVAYSSVAHLGFIVLGTFSITTQGLEGSVLQMVNHGISTGALFLLVGMISDRRHTREIAELKGLQRVAPVFAGVFMVVMLSSIGLPGLNGFIGEYLILLGSFTTARWWAVVAAVGVILAAVYLLWAYQRVFHGEPDEENRSFAELTWREGLVMAPLIGLIVFLGVYPKPFLERVEPSVRVLVTHVEAHSDHAEPDVDQLGPRARTDTYDDARQAEAEADDHGDDGEGG